MFFRILPAILLTLGLSVLAQGLQQELPSSWDLNEAVDFLNESPWARKATFTRIIGGVGSGLSGEKEIYSTFFTRLLSAKPIRKALARVHQIRAGYAKLDPQERARMDANLKPGIEADMSDWLVIAVTFRSNDVQLEKEVSRFFDTESTESLADAAFLSTDQFTKVRLAAYYPPRGDGIGAKFVFPRTVDGQPVVRSETRQILFELNVPGADPQLAVTFPVPEMIQDGEIVL